MLERLSHGFPPGWEEVEGSRVFIRDLVSIHDGHGRFGQYSYVAPLYRVGMQKTFEDAIDERTGERRTWTEIIHVLVEGEPRYIDHPRSEHRSAPAEVWSLYKIALLAVRAVTDAIDHAGLGRVFDGRVSSEPGVRRDG